MIAKRGVMPYAATMRSVVPRRPATMRLPCKVSWFAAAVLLAAAGGCTWYVYDATNKPVAAHIVGRCFGLRDNAVLSKHFSPYIAYVLNSAGADRCTPQEVTPATKDDERYKAHGLRVPQCVWVPVANIAKGTEITVTKVTEQPYGGAGRCWKVEVTLMTGSNAGKTAAIPACSLDFPDTALWLRTTSGHEYIQPLELSDSIAKRCEEDGD
jgi:hypothetical protein